MKVRLSLLLLSSFFTLTAFRPDDPSGRALFSFQPGYEVHHHDSPYGYFRLHYTLDGPDKVAAQDANDNGIPDVIETAAAIYDEALQHFLDEGFLPPLSDELQADNGGSSALDVYFLDFGGQADGHFSTEFCSASGLQCGGYMVQENDFRGYGYANFQEATRIVGSHELFHAIQAAYNIKIGPNWQEGSAVWATADFDPTLPDFGSLIQGWFNKPEKSMTQEPIGPVDAFSYGLAIWAQYLSERFSSQVIRRHWEVMAEQGDAEWLLALSGLLEDEYETTFPDEWTRFAEWAMRSGTRSEGEGFEKGATYPLLAQDSGDLPYAKEKLRVYPASIQAWGFESRGSRALSVSLSGDDPQELEGLELIFYASTSSGEMLSYGDLKEAHVLQADLDKTSANYWQVLVINTAIEGNSRRPKLCVGDKAQVAACSIAAPNNKNENDNEANDGGPGDASGEPPVEEEDQEGLDSETPDEDGAKHDASNSDSGGCSASKTGSTAFLYLTPLLFLYLKRKPKVKVQA